jgi:hypothetical protein
MKLTGNGYKNLRGKENSIKIIQKTNRLSLFKRVNFYAPISIPEIAW